MRCYAFLNYGTKSKKIYKQIADDLNISESSVFKLILGLTHTAITATVRKAYEELKQYESGMWERKLNLIKREKSYRWRDSLGV